MVTYMVSITLTFMLMIGGNPGYINRPSVVNDLNIENPTAFEKEKAITFDKLDNILSIVENFNGQTKTITTDIPENSVNPIRGGTKEHLNAHGGNWRNPQ